jgi:hypothetical protein
MGDVAVPRDGDLVCLASGVVFGVKFAGFAGMVRGVDGMAGCYMSVVACVLDFACLMGLRGVAVMLGGLHVVIGGVGMVLVGIVRSHGRSSPGDGRSRCPGHPKHTATLKRCLRTLRQYFVAGIRSDRCRRRDNADFLQ